MYRDVERPEAALPLRLVEQNARCGHHPDCAAAIDEQCLWQPSGIAMLRSDKLAGRSVKMSESARRLEPERRVAFFSDHSSDQAGRRATPIGEGCEVSILPAQDAGAARRKPDTPRGGCERRQDVDIPHRSKGGLLHALEKYAVKAQDPARCRQPEKTVTGLLNVEHRAKAIVGGPCRVMKILDCGALRF